MGVKYIVIIDIFFLSSSFQSDPSADLSDLSSRVSMCFWVKFKFILTIKTDSMCQNTQYSNISDIKHLHL